MQHSALLRRAQPAATQVHAAQVLPPLPPARPPSPATQPARPPHVQHSIRVLGGGSCVQVQYFGALAKEVEVAPHSLGQAGAVMLLGAAHAALLALALGYFSRRRRCVWCREGASDHSSETAVLLPYKCRAEGAAAGRLEAQRRRRHQTAPLQPLATGPALQAASRVSSLSSLGQTTHHAGSKAAERLFPAIGCPPL